MFPFVPLTPLNPFIPILNSLLSEPQAGLLNGVLFGVKTTIPKDLYNALITTGTLHIVALSGINITILINLLYRVTLLSIDRRIASLFSICFVVFFVWFVGASPSIVRAAIMGSLSLFAVYFGRWSWGLLSLVLAAGIMLLPNFSLIKNLSFQLSFLATLGIILAGKKVECQRKKTLLGKLIFPLKENLRLTLSAQLFTLPIILYHFHRISLISPIANLLIEWTIQPIMVLGFITALIGWVWLPLAVIPAWMVWVPLTYLISIVEFLAKIPGASIKF